MPETGFEASGEPRRTTALENFGMVQSWVAASSAAWGWQSSKSGVTIPKSFPGYGLAFAETSGFEAATHYGATNQCYPESVLFEPCQNFPLILRFITRLKISQVISTTR